MPSSSGLPHGLVGPMWAAIEPKRNKSREDGALIRKSLAEIEAFRASQPGVVQTTDSDSVAYQRVSLDAERVCQEYRMLDEAIVMIETQAKPLCTELASALAAYRGMSADFAASILAQLSRILSSQESMAAVARKAKRDIKRANDQEREEAREWREARERLEGGLSGANEKVARLEEEVGDLKKEAERLELEAMKPSWKWNEDVQDPRSTVASKEWFEAELKYARNKMEEQDMQYQQRESVISELKSSLVRSEEAKMLLEKELEEVRGVEVVVASKEEVPVVETQTVSCQTADEMRVDVVSVTPPMTGGGRSFALTMCREASGGSMWSVGWRMSLPASFRVHYERISSAKSTGRKKPRKVGKSRLSAAIEEGRGEKGCVSMSRDAAERMPAEERFSQLATFALEEDGPVLNLRATCRLIGEVWAARLAHLSLSKRRVNSTLKPRASFKGVGGAQEAEDHIGAFTYSLYLLKYGSVPNAESHITSLIRSLRAHRGENDRARVFAELASVDVKLPGRSLTLFMEALEPLAGDLRPDDDSGIMWAEAAAARQAGAEVLVSQGWSKQDAEEFCASKAAELCVEDPKAAGGGGKGGASKKGGQGLVDSDLWCETISNASIRELREEMDGMFSCICDGAKNNQIISLPRFLAVMSCLNPSITTEVLANDFDRMAGERRARGDGLVDETAIDHDQLMEYSVSHTLMDGVDDAHRARLCEAVQHFWALNCLRIKRTIGDLAARRRRLEKAYEGLEANWMSSTPGETAAACVYGRMCIMDSLDPWVQEPAVKPPPKPSFFRSEHRKLHIMKALMPPPIPQSMLEEMRMQ